MKEKRNNMELKVGMYFRSGGSIIKLENECMIDKLIKMLGKYKDSPDIKTIKSSFNIIDLIEEEDLIKYKDDVIYLIGASFSTENKEKGFRKCIFTFEGERLFLDEMTINDIKSIATKEQFTSMEYKIGE